MAIANANIPRVSIKAKMGKFTGKKNYVILFYREFGI